MAETSYGLGRQLEDSWLQELRDVFVAVAPAGTNLEVRDDNGIQFAGSTEIANMPNFQQLDSEEEDELRMRRVLQNLGAKGVLPTIGEAVGLKVTEFTVLQKEGQSLLNVKFNDQRTDVYPSAYILRGERWGLRGALGLNITPLSGSPSRAPKSSAKVGIVSGNIPNEANLRKDLRSNMSNRVFLQPAAPVHDK